MSIFTISLKKLFYSIDGFKNIFMFSLVLVIPWSLFSEILKYNQLVFYDSYNLRVFFFNSAFAIVVIIYLRSIVLSTIGFYTFIFLPFVTYYFLRKGVLYGDLQDIDELMYALGDLSSYVIYFSIFIFFLSAIFTNIRFFKVKIFLLQITFAIYIFLITTHNFLKKFSIQLNPILKILMLVQHLEILVQ